MKRINNLFRQAHRSNNCPALIDETAAMQNISQIIGRNLAGTQQMERLAQERNILAEQLHQPVERH